LLKRWLALPLKNLAAINERLNCVEFLMDHKDDGNAIAAHLKQFADIERLVSKVSIGKITPRELIQLNKSLLEVHPIKRVCEDTKNNQLKKIGEQLNPCLALTEKISATINEDAPVLLAKGGVIKTGVSSELDEYRGLKSSGNNYLNAMKEREMEATKIPSLKIGFNNVFGYYIEVTNTHKDKVPESWIRKQTLVNCERYITEELKEYETKILSAEEKISALEATLYNQLVFEVSEYMQPIQYNAALIAQLDCLLNFSILASKNRYYKPELTTKGTLKIINGRHPVIETTLPLGEKYIENSIELNQESQQIIMITGPNMSGKSAILRQTALISLLAQIGCFVPAEQAELSIVDKIFTRVGASDNISQGESTFMVEMNETASILNNLSENSLVILDEIGRGTSTYDGISIAWAITEYLHEHATKPKTLFATHYHELNDMTLSFERIKNYNVSIQETKNKIIFLRKLIPGGSEHSFGIHVAKMAGMPTSLIAKANSILKKLESSHSTEKNKHEIAQAIEENNMQLSIFQLDDPTLFQVNEQLQSIDINTLTPVEALMKLNEIKKIIGSK
jgi:DNA mismatch repair protein MutS